VKIFVFSWLSSVLDNVHLWHNLMAFCCIIGCSFVCVFQLKKDMFCGFNLIVMWLYTLRSFYGSQRRQGTILPIPNAGVSGDEFKALRLSKVLSRPFYGALYFLCGKDFCHLQRAKYHRWKNPPVTSLFTLKAEEGPKRLHYRSLSKESKNNITFSGFLLNKCVLLKQTE
jgi:hypothetical protein